MTAGVVVPSMAGMTTLSIVPPVVEAGTDPLRKHRLDLPATESGKWVDVRGDKWLVARIGCTASAKARADALAHYKLAPDAEIPPHLLDAVQGWIFAHSIVRGVKFADAPHVVYGPDLGQRIWSDPELRDLRTALLTEANGDYTQEAVTKAAILGNC